jgi:hypothetical protein
MTGIHTAEQFLRRVASFITVLEIRKRSPVPLYGAAVVWALYCLLLPTFKLWHFLPPLALAAAAVKVLSKFFPGTVERVEVPESPAQTGDEATDSLLRDGREASDRIRRFASETHDPDVAARIEEIAQITDKIVGDVREDPSDYAQIRRFIDVFIPETVKILSSYTRLAASGAGGESVDTVKSRLINLLDTVAGSFRRQYDALFNNQVVDLETDIQVLENLLKMEGLTQREFGK